VGIHRSEDDRGVVTLIIDSPATRNALGVTALEHLTIEFAKLDTARAVVIAPTGPIFCSGADRADLADAGRTARVTELLTDLLQRIDELSVPVICRVNGDAYGAGLALLAAADISISVDSACFALPEVRFGLAATVAAAACVPRIGETAALDLLLTGRRFGAVEAHRMGLLTSVADGDALVGAVDQAVGEVLLGDPLALDISKQLARGLGGNSLRERLELAARLAKQRTR
jgi:enoyl-CoA hydratase/carnithine racemase